MLPSHSASPAATATTIATNNAMSPPGVTTANPGPALHARMPPQDPAALHDCLLQAIRAGNALRVNELLADGKLTPEQLTASHEPASSPLLLAVETRHIDIARALLQAGASADIAARGCTNPLMMAAHHNDIAMIELLIAYGAAVDAIDEHGLTALMHAVIQDEAQAAQALVAAGASLRRRNNAGNTAQMIAEHWLHAELARQLATWAAQGAGSASSAGSAATPTLTASINLRGDGVAALLEAVRRRDHASLKARIDAWRRAKCDLSQELNRLGTCAEAGTGNDGPCTALMLAARLGDEAACTVLLDAGAALDIADNKGCTALLHAAAHGHAAVVDELQRWGADIRHRDAQGNDAMLMAIKGAHARVVERLIALRMPSAPVHRERGRIYAQALLLRAAEDGCTAAVHAALRLGAKVDVGDAEGQTALIQAAAHGHTETEGAAGCWCQGRPS